MSYEPTNWKTGDVVTSAKLNKLEQGVAGGVLVVHIDETGTLDKTWQEIHDALADGKTVTCFRWNDGDDVSQNRIFAVDVSDDSHPGYYEIQMFDFGAMRHVIVYALGKDGYPKLSL